MIRSEWCVSVKVKVKVRGRRRRRRSLAAEIGNGPITAIKPDVGRMFKLQ